MWQFLSSLSISNPQEKQWLQPGLLESVCQLKSCTGRTVQLPDVFVCHSSSAVHGTAACRGEARELTANTPQAVWPDWSRTQNLLSLFKAGLFLQPSLSFIQSPSCKPSVPHVYLLLIQGNAKISGGVSLQTSHLLADLLPMLRVWFSSAFHLH